MALGWIILGGVILIPAVVSVIYIRGLRASRGFETPLSTNVRWFIIVRITELLSFPLVITASILLHSRWILIAAVVPMVVLPLVRRTLKRRELRAERTQ